VCQMGTMAAIYPTETRGAVTSKEVVVAGADAEEIKIEGIGRDSDRNRTIKVGAIKKIWAVESTSMFPMSPVDLPN
jgi:hypothetical protein